MDKKSKTRMPAISEIKSSWADEVELDSGSLPQPTETYEKDLKIVTSYKFGENDKKIQIVRTYKISKQIVSKTVALRKTWAKYGDSQGDKAGPSAQTTMVSEDINMQFITNKEEEKTNELALDPSKNIAKCRICNGEHWSVNCHYKGTTMEKLMDQAKPSAPASAETSSSGTKGGKYVPPFLKDGGGKGGMSGLRGRDDTTAIRISNLSESMVEADLEELVKKIGPHNKMYLARDKNSGLCKGFAYVHFKTRKDAQTAIDLLHGHGYDHLILNVEWSKPQTQN